VHGRILGKIALNVKFTFLKNFAMMQAMKSTNKKTVVKKNFP
jgi:hypothetical protein